MSDDKQGGDAGNRADAQAGETAGQARDDCEAGEGETLHVHRWFWSIVGALFILAVVVRLSPGAGPLSHSFSMAALMLSLAALFVACFTGWPSKRTKDMFVFAYAFTFGAFALLLLPFVADGWGKQKDASRIKVSALELVRGCVRDGAMGGLSAVSAVVRCPSRSSVDTGTGEKVWPHGLPTRYSLLLVIGGVTATVEGDDQSIESKDTKQAAVEAAAKVGAAGESAPAGIAPTTAPATPLVKPAPTATSAQQKAASSVDSTKATGHSDPVHVEVAGGLAVPLFVLVLAYIGGAVSLSRRIPEYQRRMHPCYRDTGDKQPRMRAFEVRESVVFQIMQLVSAPFLAIATWYIVSPMTLASAATLAFGTGFASEPLLMMIRGLVEGIRPEGSKFQPSSPATGAPGPMGGKVLPMAGSVLPANLVLELSAAGSSPAAGATATRLSVAADGSFKSAALAPGRYRLQAIAAAGPVFKPVEVDLPAGGRSDVVVQLAV